MTMNIKPLLLLLLLLLLLSSGIVAQCLVH
jgi:hypothetical protein